MRRLRLLAIVLLTGLLAAPAFAQGTTGTLTGNVTDEQGGALPGANVTVTNTATGFTRSTTADSTGEFNLPGLPVGAYEIKSELSGFAPRTMKGISINVAATTNLQFKMSVATQTEEVTVTAEAPLIDVKETGVG